MLFAAAFLVTGESDTAAALNRKVLTITLGPGRDASQTGMANLYIGGGIPTEVVIEIQAGPVGVEQPAHVHAGICPDVAEVVYSLNTVVDGTSATTIDPTLQSLEDGNFAIDVHKSEAEIAVQVACGDIRYEGPIEIETGTGVAPDLGPREVISGPRVVVPTPAPTPTPEPAVIPTSEPPTPLAATAASNPADDDGVSPFWFVLGGVGGAVALLGGASIIWHYRRVR
jgi:hypothetical protein